MEENGENEGGGGLPLEEVEFNQKGMRLKKGDKSVKKVAQKIRSLKCPG